ncbi:DUF2125 domain-containing protein [Gemmobacter fulvus]|uniref:DUF2125 domain-containing protein n=1 Tax=Gemmobacter fulvus TaxID=2840474 RepID=A0A975P4Y5_9RHOB|nr:DUF2125 domain-containing protein [Gemmobacter fulvus]MBT9245721.1 DUF2125 domain-containing protein [Gemmobacter fulvus]QWK89432.1 DUF2125 domain-containing protein [Gemmobacter fulvus]
MTQWKFMCSTALVALVAANAALADVTPDEVWENWKTLSTSYGQTITTQSEVTDGDALIISGLEIKSSQDGAEASITVEELTFTDNGDGSVDVTMSDSYPMTIRADGIDGKPDVVTTLTISHPELVITASGSAAETRYDFEGPTLAVKLDGVEGTDAPTDMKVDVTVTDLAGNYIVTGDEAKAISSNMTAAALAMVIAGTDPEDGSKISANFSLADLAGTASGKTVADMTDLAAALKAGFGSEGSFTYGATSYDMTVNEPAGETKVTGGAAGGDLNFVMDAARLGYGGGAKDVTVSISGAQIPFPQVNLAYKEGAFNFVMPVSKGDAPSDFALMTKLVDLTISDEIWAMFDPTNQLPRDPMTLVLDTKGTAKLNVDLMDQKAMEALGEGMPGELNSLDLTALQLKMAGAEVTGTGALTFDNTDLVTFGGVPAPTGKVELKAVGVNGLLDKLMAMGLVPEDQMMGARMMLGMFAKVVEGQPDTMTSTLEFKDKGFFANGMQLQ